jgi:hypothetical protein
MPELPAVERGRRLAEQALVGRRIERVATVHDAIVYTGVSPRRFASALRGRRVLAACRWGKFIWLELDRRPWPVFHFGMTGSFQVYEDARHRPPFWKVELQMETGQRLAMCNKRRLGRIRLQTDPRHEPPIRRLGFDALLDEPAFATFADGLRRRHAAIKAVLLDQRRGALSGPDRAASAGERFDGERSSAPSEPVANSGSQSRRRKRGQRPIPKNLAVPSPVEEKQSRHHDPRRSDRARPDRRTHHRLGARMAAIVAGLPTAGRVCHEAASPRQAIRLRPSRPGRDMHLQAGPDSRRAARRTPLASTARTPPDIRARLRGR